MGIAKNGIVTIERIVENATSLETYAASQSYFSANIVALEAAGADAKIRTTGATAPLIEIPVSIASFNTPTIARGSKT